MIRRTIPGGVAEQTLMVASPFVPN